jgi:membrane-associated HD superfamily phosphohydrolase
MADENKPMKYARYAIGEIILVVIGILIALQVNNWNENRIEQNRIKKYAKSLIKDLQNDIEMLEVSRYQAETSFKSIDSLRRYVNETDTKELSNTVLYVLTRDVMYRPYKWNRSTLDELKSSGGLRFISNDSLEKKLVAYETFSQHLDEDFNADVDNAEKATDLIVKILNLSSNYFVKISEMESANFNNPFQQIFQTNEYKESKTHDLKLNTYEPTELNHFVNRFIVIQDNYRIRAFAEMPDIIKDARELIELLSKEYLPVNQ